MTTAFQAKQDGKFIEIKQALRVNLIEWIKTVRTDTTETTKPFWKFEKKKKKKTILIGDISSRTDHTYKFYIYN